MIRILALTDEPVLVLGLRQVIDSAEDIELVAVVTEVADLISQFGRERPDIALLSNLSLAGAVLTRLQQESPSTRIVLWLDDIAPELAHQAIETGVRGVLRRNLPPEMLLKCIRKVHEGELWLEKSLAMNFLFGRSVRLSRRESQMISLLGEGLKNKEIATRLAISEGTVKVYLSRLFAKVGAKDRYELALFGLRNGNGIQDRAVPAIEGLRTLFITPPAGVAPSGKPPRGFSRASALRKSKSAF
jgi:DNA-binding NarL/FixJ family response regulator